jgi:serine/threonine protein phosphatase 1
MLGALGLNRMLRGGRAPPARLPDGLVAFAIGDIHGRADLLTPLLEQILSSADQDRPGQTTIIFLGDYVDRGPASREVLALLEALARTRRHQLRFLMGNHDRLVLDFLADPRIGPTWSEFGGRETLASFGVEPPRARENLEAWEHARRAFLAAIPPAQVNFLRSLEMSCELGDYFFAHAGARPGVSLALQEEQDLLWIRESFLKDRRRFAKVIVHGHTPAEDAYADDRRIGLDTGAYATGVLSAVRLVGDRRELLQTQRGGGGDVSVRTRAL